MDNNSEKLIVFENQGEICMSAGERVLDRIGFLSKSKSKLAIEDASFYNQLLSGEFEGFEGMYIFEQNPSHGQSGMIETVTLVPFGEKSWGFIVDAQQLNSSSDEDLTLAILDESVHAKQRLAQLRQSGRLKATDKIEYEKNEIDARLHVIETYRELEKEGFKHEIYDNLVRYIDIKLGKLDSNNNPIETTREIVKDFLVRCGYKFE